jgi:hypothetical protein
MKKGLDSEVGFRVYPLFMTNKTTLPGPSPVTTSLASVLASVPWCCLLPAVLSLVSLGSSVVTRVFLYRFGWLLLPVSGLLFARALWLVQVEKRGQPWSRWVTWASTVLAIGLWLPRVWVWIAHQ